MVLAAIAGALAMALPVVAIGAPSVASAAPATGSKAGPVNPANGFASYYQATSGERLELCIDVNDVNCVAPPAAGPGWNPALPVSFPTNFPDEAFYYLAQTVTVVPPACAGVTGPGKVFIALGMEGAFANGGVAPGDQMSFGRIRLTGTGLCKQTTYRFVHPFGEMTATTDSKGIIKPTAGTSDIGCIPTPGAPCDWNAALQSPVAGGWLRWDPAVAPAADPGYLGGDFNIGHKVIGGTYIPAGDTVPTNSLRVYKGTATTPIITTDQWTIAGKLAGPLDPSPASVDFGGVALGSTSSVRTVTLTNLNQASLTVTPAATVVGTNSTDFSITNNTCTAALPRDATCTVSLTFTPLGTAQNVRTATLAVTHSGVHSPLNITVKGTATASAATVTATAAPASLDFGNQRISVLSSSQRVTVTAAGTTPLGVTALNITGTGLADFQVVSNTCVGTFVAPGATCTIDVAVVTTALLARSATLNIVSNATPSPTTVALAAFGIGGVAAVSTTIIPEIGDPSWYQDENGVRVAPCYEGSNPMCVLPPLTAPFWNPAVTTDINATPMNMPDEMFYTLADSALLSTPGCTTSTPAIAPGKAFIRMAVEGAFSTGEPVVGAQIIFGRIRAFADGLCPNTEYSFTNPYGVETFTSDLAGMISRVDTTQDIGCFPAAPAICDWKLPLQGRVFSGFLRWDPTVAPAAPAGYIGDNVTPHRIVGGSYTPPLATAPVDYLKLEKTGTIPELIGESNMWTIAGKLAGPIVANPASLNFADTAVAETSAPATVDVQNLGASIVTISALPDAITITGPNAADFTTDAICAGDTLDPLAASPAPPAPPAVPDKCTVTVTFSPTATGHRTATLIVKHSSLDSPLSVALTGLGLAAGGLPTIGLVPSALDFGTQRIGFTSPARTVTINNDGGAANLVITAITPPAGFVTSNDTCSTGPIAPNTSCTVSVAFAPTAGGTVSGTLDVTDNVVLGLPHQVTLTGIGFVGSAAASTVDPNTSFPRWYGDDNGLHLSLCLDKTDPICILPGAEPNYNPAQPVTFPTNFPSEAFYSIVDAQNIATDGCPDVDGITTTNVGTATMRLDLESAFANGAPIAGDQMTFGRIRFIVDSGLCANTPYTFVHPYGTSTFTTNAVGGFAKNGATTDIGCGTPDCDFSAALGSPVFHNFLRWDPNVTPLAPAGHIGDAITYHSVVGGTGTAGNIFRIVRPDGSTMSETNLFLAAGRIASSVLVSPTSLAFGDQIVTTPSQPQTVTVTNDGFASLTLSSIGITGTNFADFTPPGGTCNTTTAMLGFGSCTITVAFTPAATGPSVANLSVAYPGDGSPLTVALSGTGVKSATTTTVTADLNPTVVGSPVTFTATVASALPAAAVATGTVQFKVDNIDVSTPAAIDITGKATLTTSAITLAGSPHSVTAVYSGDTTHVASTSTALPHTVLAPLSTTTVLVSSVNPAVAGELITFTATVTPLNASLGVPTGSVRFTVDGTPATVALVGGVARYTRNDLTIANHTIGATYLGTASFITSLSANVTQTVGQWRLSGTVRTAKGTTLPGTVVDAYDSTTGLLKGSYTATAGGVYSIVLPGGSYKLHITPNPTTFAPFWVGGTSQATATVIVMNISKILTITVISTFTLSGTVRTAKGTTLPGSVIAAYDTTGLVLQGLFTATAGGVYSIALPQGGSYKLRITPNPTTFAPFWVGGSSAANATVIVLNANTVLAITVK